MDKLHNNANYSQSQLTLTVLTSFILYYWDLHCECNMHYADAGEFVLPSKM